VLLSLFAEMKEYGRRFLAELGPDETALVLFGRPYNAFSTLGNLGIPHKFASRGNKIIPHDFLPLDEADGDGLQRMYWSSGQSILRGARFIIGHPNLFGVYITSFSCGPDSFIVGTFREIMGKRPSLTLELDAHTADAGVDTRIEAFLDIIRGYRELALAELVTEKFIPTRFEVRGRQMAIVTGDGETYRLTDPRVHVLVPSMGNIAAQGMAAAFRYVGVRADPLPPAERADLVLGKGGATCKECLPLHLTSGSLLRYLRDRQDDEEIVAYFMPDADGPCRFGQYTVFLDGVIRKHRIRNVAPLTLSFENGYAGMSTAFTRRAWQALTLADGLEDLYAGILTIARDRDRALAAFTSARESIMASVARDSRSGLLAVIEREMRGLARFERNYPLRDAVKVSLTGEIYVRREGFSRQFLVERLAEKGILVKAAPLAEWLYYSDHCVTHDLSTRASFAAKCSVKLKTLFMRRDERDIQQCLSLSGFYEPCRVDMEYLMEKGAHLVNPELNGETILTVGGALSEVGDDCHGVISIGPFGCMPCRVAEAIITNRLTAEKERFSRHNAEFWSTQKTELPLPFLAIESDGNSFPQVVEARLESLALSAHRLRDELREKGCRTVTENGRSVNRYHTGPADGDTGKVPPKGRPPRQDVEQPVTLYPAPVVAFFSRGEKA
jgi:predicted nucleotide-binding protein (sugar kinase/HSP70/actin superfamily)